LPLGREQVLDLLDELAGELEAAGLHGDMFLVGGAAMALAYDARRVTADLDAIFEPKQAIYELAARIGARRGLPANWVNDAVKGLLPGPDPAPLVLYERPGLSVRVASPRYLFALKAHAARRGRDDTDLKLLYRLSGFRSPEEALDYVAATYPEGQILPKTQYFLFEILKDARPGARPAP